MKQLKLDIEVPEGCVVKFASCITIKGRGLYAKAYGKKARPILVKA